MNKYTLSYFLLLTSLLVSGLLYRTESAHAEFKLATVDLNRILNESAVAKEERKTLDSLTQATKKKLDTKKVSLSALEKQIKEKGLGEESKEVQTFGNDVKNFNRLVKDSEEEIKREFLKVNKALTEKALKIINAYADKKKLDLVIDRSDKARGPVLFGDPAVDITNDIIKEMDQG